MHKDIFVEKDWKRFRKKVADWQEKYIEKLTREYIDLLSGDGNASDKFWELDKRMKKDKKKAGVLITDMSRSNMIFITMQLLDEKVITMDDLADFSEGLKERLEFLYRR
jgi:hypothetical protein